ncbi:MAG: phycobilisome rod-core linker polypeptide [Scytolyngbya sp. HA4215-MV1]|nr:phycobilisome rod-core linker polypeptide [Scytolyngbya sp. HA4215-MV1]
MAILGEASRLDIHHSYIDSLEYQQRFGEAIVPYYQDF